MEWIWSQNYYIVYLLSQYIADIISPNVPRFEVKAHLHVKK